MKENEIIDLDPFTHTHFDNIELITFVHAVFLLGHKNNSTIFNSELCWQFLYDICGLTTTCFAGESEILVVLDIRDTISMLKTIYNMHEILHKYLTITASYMKLTEEMETSRFIDGLSFHLV